MNTNPCRSIAKKSRTNTMKSKELPSTVMKSSLNTENDIINADHNLIKSWGQQFSPTCGCVLRLETKTDRRQKIVDSSYVAKSVVTTINNENGGRLEPVYSTRKKRPMFQECKCKSLHALAKNVTSYLPNKSWNRVRGITGFTSTRSSIAFRHAVLSEHGLPPNDTHCFDLLEEAFTGLFNGYAPSKRRFDTQFGKILAAESLQRSPIVHYQRTKGDKQGDLLHTSLTHNQRIETIDNSVHQSLGADSNRMYMSTPETINTIGMFQNDAETPRSASTQSRT